MRCLNTSNTRYVRSVICTEFWQEGLFLRFMSFMVSCDRLCKLATSTSGTFGVLFTAVRRKFYVYYDVCFTNQEALGTPGETITVCTLTL